MRRLLLLLVAVVLVVGCTGGDDEPGGLKRIELPGGGSALRSSEGDLYRRTADGVLRPLYKCSTSATDDPVTAYGPPECHVVGENGDQTTIRIDPVTLRTFDEATAKCAAYFVPGLMTPVTSFGHPSCDDR